MQRLMCYLCGVKLLIFSDARMKIILFSRDQIDHRPQQMAQVFRAIERNCDFRGIPWSFHLIRLAQGVLPTSWFDCIIGHWAGIYHTMDHFTGRK